MKKEGQFERMIEQKMKPSTRMNIFLLVSFLVAALILFLGGLKERESLEIVQIVLTMSLTMAGFGLVAFQISHASDEIKKDFIETSIIMIISSICAFFYLIYPKINLFGLNFGESSIFLFFWALILLLIILVDRRFDILK
jgi:cation transport ATPase